MLPNRLEKILDASNAARERTRELIAASYALHCKLASKMQQLRSLHLQPPRQPGRSALDECSQTGRMNLWDNMAKASELRHASQQVCIAFLHVELETARTFVNIATEAGDHYQKRQRNLTNALKAYQTILNWRERLAKSEGAAVQIQSLEPGVEQLRGVLQKLGAFS